MRALLRNTALNPLGSFKKIGNGVHILNSHYISRNDVSTSVFTQLLKKIKNQADFIKIEDAVQLIAKKEKINQKLVAFTFDDGFEECYTKISPTLDKFDTNAAFFINPGFIDGNENYIENFNQNIVHVNKQPMTWSMVKELHQTGFIIGNHSMDHTKFIGLSDKELQHQITNSKNIIEKYINDKCDYFAWTYGKLTDIDNNALNAALNEHKYVFSSDNFTKYHSLNNDRIINRRHIEGDWPFAHVKYFISHNMEY
jgi:peptidoglycan/xylan/chitin deacetylase (PgdA/CDA1 family)